MSITVVKRNGQREPYDANKINLAIEEASSGLPDSIAWVTQIATELEITLFDGISTQQLDEGVIQVALQNVKDDPAFDVVAARLLLKTIYKRVLGDFSSREQLMALHRVVATIIRDEGALIGMMKDKYGNYIVKARFRQARSPRAASPV